MNVSPVQNNSQSFGMAFKLKGDGAKKLATFLEEANPATNKYLMEDLIKPINELKTTDVVYDGKKVLINGKPFFSVSDCRPEVFPGLKTLISYSFEDGSDYWVKYKYDVSQNLRDFPKSHPLLRKLFNAREIAKDIDAKVSKAISEIQQTVKK